MKRLGTEGARSYLLAGWLFLCWQLNFALPVQAQTAGSCEEIEARLERLRSENLYNLEHALDTTARERCTKRACNFFVETAALKLGVNLVGQAYQINERVTNFRDWRQVSPHEAVQYADAGGFVIGSAKGHVAVVAPSRGKMVESSVARGPVPYVRGDTKDPEKWENYRFDPKAAVGANWVFDFEDDPPRWFLYVGESENNALNIHTVESVKTQIERTTGELNRCQLQQAKEKKCPEPRQVESGGTIFQQWRAWLKGHFPGGGQRDC